MNRSLFYLFGAIVMVYFLYIYWDKYMIEHMTCTVNTDCDKTRRIKCETDMIENEDIDMEKYNGIQFTINDNNSSQIVRKKIRLYNGEEDIPSNYILSDTGNLLCEGNYARRFIGQPVSLYNEKKKLYRTYQKVLLEDSSIVNIYLLNTRNENKSVSDITLVNISNESILNVNDKDGTFIINTCDKFHSFVIDQVDRNKINPETAAKFWNNNLAKVCSITM